MVNLRVTRLTVRSNVEIEVTFTTELNTDISIDNFTIVGVSAGTSDATITSISISSNVLSIFVRPIVPRAQYKLVIESTSSQTVQGLRGETFIEDGATNHIYFLGAREDNQIRDDIIDDLPPIYDNDGLIFDTIDVGAEEILKSSQKAGEVKSANYVSIEVTDESITRGSGPFDRFANEGVFQILRVGSTETGTNTSGSLSFTEFPSDPVSLQQITVTSEEVSNTVNDANAFVGLLITLAKGPVIALESLVLERDSVQFTYDIEQFRYGIKESKFDTDNAYPALDITDNQIRLSSSAVGPSFPLPQGSDKMIVTYLYKRLGREVSATSVAVTSTIDVIRESVPAVATSFFLDNAPIVDSAGAIATSAGVTWLDPATNFDSTEKHPSFVTEIQFDASSLPSNVGEFAVNYVTGQVFTYGEDDSGVDGTTTIPPVATYKYLNTYQDGLDYIFFSDLDEIASLPDRDLRGGAATVSFEFEDTFASGTDFVFSSHVEVVNERVENRLIDTIGVRTVNNPVNEVFRIFNETTGEVYTTSRISGNEVFFTAINPPVLKTIEREAAEFDQVVQSQIVITDEIAITGKPFVAFRILLTDTNIVASTGDYLGASFNTSLTLSDDTVFVREFYYDPDDTLNENLVRLQIVGDYMVDYDGGIVYVAVVSGSSTTVGDATYRRGKIKTRNSHVVRVDNVYRSPSVTLPNVSSFTIGAIEDQLIEITDLVDVGVRENSAGTTLVVVSGTADTITVSQDIHTLRHIFQVTDLQVTADPIDFASTATVSSSNPNIITLNADGVSVTDNNSGAGLEVVDTGARKYVPAQRLSALSTASLAQLVSASSVSDISTGSNYFAQGSDGYVDATTNRIYLPTSTSAVAGDKTTAIYNAKLLGGAAVLVDFTPGDVFIDYTYSRDELLISYEYGDNVLDWSISDSLEEGEEYFVTYRHGALRTALRDNFGVLTSIEEISVIPEELDRETYRNAIKGSLQSFPKGPTIPAIQGLAEAFTQITPNIIESVFLEWILGRDHLHLSTMELDANTDADLPTFAPGKFGDGLLLNKDGQTATLPASSNISFNEGTWEAFVVPEWDGIANDATLTLNLLFDGDAVTDKVFIGPDNTNPEAIPFTLDSSDPTVLGRPSSLHKEIGYFIWYDTSSKKWRVRARGPILESRLFSGSISTTGEFHDVRFASTADGYDGYDGYEITEVNDVLKSTNDGIRFAFVVDAYDSLNMAFDAYDSYDGPGLAGFDGFDFTSDNVHYFYDTGVESNQCRMSLYKDGKGFLRFRVHDENKRVKMLSADISDWLAGETHHVATSWKLATIEMQDEMHLFIDGVEVPNTYRFTGYLPVPPDGSGTIYMDEAIETLVSSVSSPTIGGFDLSSIEGSNVVTSLGSDFSSVAVGSRFLIIDNTDDGDATQASPFVYVKSVLGQNQLELEVGPAGSAVDYDAAATLSDIRFSVNPLSLLTVSDPSIEDVRVFSADSSSNETELRSPVTTTPQYVFSKDGYKDFIELYDGLSDGYSAILRTYGLNQARCKQQVYIWGDQKSNLIRTIMPAPTAISKVNITAIIVKRINVSLGLFALIATDVGGHLVPVLISNLDFCQPSNDTTGRTLDVTVSGDNIDYSALNQVVLIGDTTDGYGTETVSFNENGTQRTTRLFKTLTDVIASVTPIDTTKDAGSVEIREAFPISWQENGGTYAEVHLSVQEQTGINGTATSGGSTVTDAYSRFGAEDIGKIFNITSPVAIAGTYTITDVAFESSGTVKDSNTVTLDTTWGASYTDINWSMLTTSYGDSGFANGLITLETARSGGAPFLIRSCWYEVDFPTYLTAPWTHIPDLLYIGSDINGQNQAGAVIDEMRLLDELSNDTGLGETAPASGRSVTTDANAVREFSDTTQTLGLFHFDNDVSNSASFLTNFEKTFRQSENSVNSNFNQSIIFNRQESLQVDNKAVFQNDEGTIEFWVSPILDTYNDPRPRFYIDLSPEQTADVTAVSALTVPLTIRARTISSVTIAGSNVNFFTGGSLSTDGTVITLGQALPGITRDVTVTFVPITSNGDRFSIYKNETGSLVLSVSASGVDYQISAPVYWKKNTWHRVFVGWDLNNADNQDRLILIVDGTEGGSVRYGTGLLYGTGIQYGQPTVWGSADAGTTAARNILDDINMTDVFNTVHIGADFTGQFTALARMDNIRFSSELRTITLLGGEGPGQLIGKDLLFTSNINSAQPVIEDALTRLLLDFNTTQTEVENLATVRDNATGIFDFFLEVIDTFELADTDLVHNLITQLVNRIKPGHTRAFVSFTK